MNTVGKQLLLLSDCCDIYKWFWELAITSHIYKVIF